MADRTSATHEFTHHLNVENAKIVAFLMVSGFILYHGVLHLKYGNDSCTWLLSDGRFPGYSSWQPYGCMMHKYTKADARMCMHYVSYWGGRNHITFVGDSRIRQLYFEFINLISTKPFPEYKAHQDIHFQDEKISARIDFLWHPMVNLSMFHVYKNWLLSERGARPNLIITGSAAWCIKLNNGSRDSLNNFKVNLTTIVPHFNKLKDTTKILWMLQDPVIEEKLGVNRSMITNEQIDDYNKVALDVLKHSGAQLWKSSRLVAQGMKKETVDGLHISKMALELDTQILLNSYCNNDMNHHDGTCCNTPEQVTTLQIITASFFLVCLVSAIALFIYRHRLRRNGAKLRAENGVRNHTPVNPVEHTDSCYEVSVSLAKLGLIMSYFYLCDRTNFFMKENKYYTHVNFFLPFAYVMILGFFFTEKTDKTAVLHRDQTDEWKGWMQLVFLIYHLTGASKVLPVYMQIRVLVSSYLFLTGYGHFSYFWHKGEYGLVRYYKHSCRHFPFYWHSRKNGFRRLFEVLFRLNLLVVLLCLVMNRPYQFYYFVPLVSYWFITIYITMAFWPQSTQASADASTLHYFFVIIKFIVLVVIITLFFMSEVFFEKVFLTRPFKALFVTSDDSIHEWRFRWQLDRYSVVYGMLFAFGYNVLTKYKVINDRHSDNLFSKYVSWTVGSLGLIGLGSYAAFSFLCGTKQQCNEVHSYIAFIPIVSYIILRNVPGWLRTRYSTFFAWFGKISLEIFISQYHIWLAADTHGVLVLIPSYPVLNVILTSFIFICISHEISKITHILANHVVPNDWKLLLRNTICFFAVLVPICVTNGVISL